MLIKVACLLSERPFRYAATTWSGWYTHEPTAVLDVFAVASHTPFVTVEDR